MKEKKKSIPIKIVRTGRFHVLGLPSEQDVVVVSGRETNSTTTIQQRGGGALAPANTTVTTTTNGNSSSSGSSSNHKKKKDSNNNKSKQQEQQEGRKKQDTNVGGEQQQQEEERIWTDELQADYERILSVGEECISPEELKTLLLMKGRRQRRASDSGDSPASDGGGDDDGSSSGGFNLYDGFEPSGRMHIAQGVYKAMNVNKCTYDGTNSTFVFWVADWFALMNDKMNGDLDKIKTVGLYLIEVWKAAGMNLKHVTFKWASDEITKHANIYWPQMLDIARRFNITRIKKCCQIMGRLEGNLTAAQILYPIMQCTDIFFLHADICQLGVDQRKVNMLAREYCLACKRKYKPVILSHHMLYGLKVGQEKMSKSDPDSAIFMEDTMDDVHRKIMNAYCPIKKKQSTATTEEKQQEQQSTKATATAAAALEEETTTDAGKESMHLTEDTLKNPCLDYVEHIIFSQDGATFTITTTTNETPPKTYNNFTSVKHDFLNGIITEQQLKDGLIKSLNLLLEPVRQHFTNDEYAKKLFETVKQYKKEATTTTSSSNTNAMSRRLDLVKAGIVPSNTHLVFVPLPTHTPTLQMIVNILIRIRNGLELQDDDDEEQEEEDKSSNEEEEEKQKKKKKKMKKCILFCSDWSARVCNACDADIKIINAYYQIVITALTALDPILMKEHVQIVYQSDAILYDPSNYWISVINAGRYYNLNQVMDGPQDKDSDGVGISVISRLMRIADVAGISPTTIAMPMPASKENDDNDHDDDNDVETINATVEKKLIEQFITEKLCCSSSSLADSSSSSSTIMTTPPRILQLNAKCIRLQPKRESEALKTENDEYYILDDPKVHGKVKVKKAFCEEGNISFCPPIALASVFAFRSDNNNNDIPFIIERSDDNGGNKTYNNINDLIVDFQSKVLHPGDLKTCIMKLMVHVLEKLNTAYKNDVTTTKAIKDMKAYTKKKTKNIIPSNKK